MYTWQTDKEVASDYYEAVITFRSLRNGENTYNVVGNVTALFKNDYKYFEEFMTYLMYKYERCPETQSAWVLAMFEQMTGLRYRDEIKRDWGRNIAYVLWHNYRLSGSPKYTSIEIYNLMQALIAVIIDNWGYENKLY